MMTKTYDNNLQVFEGCKILRQKRNYFKMFKGVKLSKEKFQHESQKTSWDLYELKSWSVLCRKVVKSLQSHMAQRLHTSAHKSSPVWCHPFPRAAETKWCFSGGCWTLSRRVHLCPKFCFPKGSCRMSCSMEGSFWWQQAALSCCFYGGALFPSYGCACTHPFDKRRQNQAVTNRIYAEDSRKCNEE